NPRWEKTAAPAARNPATARQEENWNGGNSLFDLGHRHRFVATRVNAPKAANQSEPYLPGLGNDLLNERLPCGWGEMPVAFTTRCRKPHLQRLILCRVDVKRPPKTFRRLHSIGVQSTQIALIQKLTPLLLVIKGESVVGRLSLLKLRQLGRVVPLNPCLDGRGFLRRQEDLPLLAARGGARLACCRKLVIELVGLNRVHVFP